MAWTPKPFRKELLEGLRTFLLTDAVLKAKLGTDTNIWQETHAELTVYPAITLAITERGNNPRFIGVGNLKPRVSIAIYGIDGDTLDSISNDLERLLTIPIVNRDRISFENFRITNCYRDAQFAEPIVVRKTEQGSDLLWMPSEWQMALRQIGS